MKLSTLELMDCIGALAIAIVREDVYSADRAFELYFNLKAKKRQTDINELIKLKELGMSYKEIGDIFGITSSTVHKRIKDYYEKMIK